MSKAFKALIDLFSTCLKYGGLKRRRGRKNRFENQSQ